MASAGENTLPTARRLAGISPKAYEHPADRAATAALHAIPFLDEVVKRLIEFGYERAMRQFYLANAIKVGPRQLPHVWDTYTQVLATFDLDETYDLYIYQLPQVNAFTLGADRPIIVLQSGLVNLLDPEELRGVIAHEVGHIHSGHALYRTALLILLQISLSQLPVPVIAGLPIMALQLALLEWYRASELTCDRAAILALGDPLVYCRALMKTSGGLRGDQLNLDAFLAQSNTYEEWEDTTDKSLRFFLELGATHPFGVRRVSELSRWVASGEYDRILGGSYVRRGEEPPPTSEFARAADHYNRQIGGLLREASNGINNFTQKLQSWLEETEDDERRK